MFNNIQFNPDDFISNFEEFKKTSKKPTDERSNINGDTFLHQAVASNRKEIVEYLLKEGANVNVLGYKGNTPLHYAYQHHHLNIITILKTKGADDTIKNEYQKTPQDYSVQFTSSPNALQPNSRGEVEPATEELLKKKIDESLKHMEEIELLLKDLVQTSPKEPAAFTSSSYHLMGSSEFTSSSYLPPLNSRGEVKEPAAFTSSSYHLMGSSEFTSSSYLPPLNSRVEVKEPAAFTSSSNALQPIETEEHLKRQIEKGFFSVRPASTQSKQGATQETEFFESQNKKLPADTNNTEELHLLYEELLANPQNTDTQNLSGDDTDNTDDDIVFS